MERLGRSPGCVHESTQRLIILYEYVIFTLIENESYVILALFPLSPIIF